MQTCLDAMEIEQQAEGTVDPERPMTGESTLPSSDVPEETITHKANDEGVASVISEATDSGLSAQGLTLEVMLERVLLLEPLMIDTLQVESMVKNREIESDEASARITIDSHSPSTKSSTGIGDFTIARPAVLGQARDSINDRTSAAAHATFQSSETNVRWAGVSSKASDGPLVIDSHVSEEKLSVKFGCERPLACTTSEGQEDCEKGAIIPPGDVQSMLINLAQSNIEQKQSTPNLMPDVGGDERPGDRTMLENTGSADSASVEVGTANTATSSPQVRGGPARISRSFPAEDKHDHSNSPLFDPVHQAPFKIGKGQLGYTADAVGGSPRIRHKLPPTKRKRVARSENNASLRLDFAASMGGHEDSVIEGTSTDHPLPRVAVCSQTRPKVFASKYTQQRPDANTKVQSTHGSQALELLQSSIREVRAQCHGKLDRHSHEPQRFVKITKGSKSLASQNPRDEGIKERRVDLDRGVETPSTQPDENIREAKWKRIETRTRVAKRPGEGSNDSTEQNAMRSRAKVSIAMNSDHESGPISTSGGGLVASTGSDADVGSLKICTKTNTETYTRDGSNAGSSFGDADGFGNERAAKTPQASSTDAKERLPGKRQHHTEQIPAPIEHVDGSGDGRSKAICKEYEGSAGVMLRESEGVLAGSYPESQNSLFPSSRHQQLPFTITDHHKPNFSHTDSEIHRSNKVPATTKSAQASQRRRRANKTSTASGHRTSFRGSMSTSRGSIPGVRGQSHGRSSNQDDNDAPIPWPSRAPSVASNSATRRPRGFQPAEVGRSKSNINTGVTFPAPPKAEAAKKHRESATVPQSTSIVDVEAAFSASPQAEAVSQSHSSTILKSQPGIESLTKINQAKVAVEAEVLTTALLAQTSQEQNEVIAELLAKARTPKSPSHHQGKAPRPNGSTIVTPRVQTVTIDASRPEFDPVHVSTSGDPSPSEASTIPIIIHNEPKQSCWSRAVTTDTAPPAKAEWDNCDNPIDNPTWMRAPALPTSDCKGPVVANFRNLPPYKLIGVKKTVAPSTQKKAEGTWPSGSFNRQMANIQETLRPSQQQPTSTPSVGASKVNHAGKGKANNCPPHLRHPSSHSKANNEDDVSKAGEATNAVMKNYTPPPHRQGPSIENRLPVYHSPFPNSPSRHPVEAASPSNIDIEEELAAELAVDIEKDAQVAAAVAAGDPHDDQQFAAGLQARFDNEQMAAKPQQMGKVASDARVDTRPPHLRASQQKHEAPAVVAKPQHQLPAAIQPAPILQDPYTNAIASHAGPLKDVTKSRRNAKVTSPLEGIALPNEVESAAKKGKKAANELNPRNGVSDLVGWDGKMTPALLGEDWEVRAPHNRHGQEKLAVIQTWTQDHAVNPEAGLVRAEDRLMSPISIKHPVTKPNPDEFNQAKRHMNTDDHIQAYKAKHSSSVDNTTPSSRGRMSREEKREARRRYAEEERNRVYPPNEHAPAANIYLRPAEFKDMRQVSFLHNHYVLKTACAHDLEETNELYWRQRLQETIDENDPFLVAVHMGSKPINNLRDVHRKKSETIVGFAFAADYGLQTHAYRFTVELEMWVHQDHLHQGIGRSMLDRMLAALDPGYNLLECAPFLCGDMLSRWVSGSHCLVKTILVNMLHNEDEKKDVEWKRDWLSNKNDFKYCGTLPGMGHKFGKDVDIAQMIMRTSAAMPPSPFS